MFYNDMKYVHIFYLQVPSKEPTIRSYIIIIVMTKTVWSTKVGNQKNQQKLRIFPDNIKVGVTGT